MKHYCNPVNINYRYQFSLEPNNPNPVICREAADPSMLYFKGKSLR